MKKILTSIIVSILSISSLYGAYNDTNTDYTNAKTDFWTKVDALEPLEAINQIICFTQQLHPELMVNKGVYSALIDNKKCSKTQSTTQNTENEYILANVVRENDISSQIMNIWITEDNQDDVKVRMEVIKEPSDTNPIGQFNITWKLFKLGIQTGEAEIKTILTNDGQVGYTLYTNFDKVEDAFRSMRYSHVGHRFHLGGSWSARIENFVSLNPPFQRFNAGELNEFIG